MSGDRSVGWRLSGSRQGWCHHILAECFIHMVFFWRSNRVYLSPAKQFRSRQLLLIEIICRLASRNNYSGHAKSPKGTLLCSNTFNVTAVTHTYTRTYVPTPRVPHIKFNPSQNRRRAIPTSVKLLPPFCKCLLGPSCLNKTFTTYGI